MLIKISKEQAKQVARCIVMDISDYCAQNATAFDDFKKILNERGKASNLYKREKNGMESATTIDS